MRYFFWIVATIAAIITVAGIIWAWFESDAVAVGTFALALTTLLLAFVAFNEMQEGRKQAQETQRASLRPLLIPAQPLGLGSEPDRVAGFWTMNGSSFINVRNVGSGVATNVRGVLLPSVEPTPSTDQVFSIRAPLPIQHGRENSLEYMRGATRLTANNHIGGYSLGAPIGHQHVARFTLTYWDIFGSRHASVFDLTILAEREIWQQVAILDGISQDLSEMDR